ncbi:MAG: hypothetical protein A2802_00370 [Candidatus Woykebacteria bacterium RIFCSPHIGHO2_01_FULL_43_29]|uniref:UDP-N-acetylmuramyl-tripeptide synthetase n=1 Tax=Candidatus Woykebacteria bacterium RIFCSPHIGHO2_02_FULL_43_16b TaxID=1802601 RepID=A0A1G1WN31_9BACT|nr:MAG: hypothetical protein A2802_00370 [Candidatus Woykebacteria bacterium RIFCSPHIGHO2_01_FULL_43_29]OGY29094.1 MAG: hypothetical protein A3J50_02305 [Candidatus Woykebacteria bacterium RIFCSPHIGHO2_02_FULL_43_16b]
MRQLKKLMPQNIRNTYHLARAFGASHFYGRPVRKLKIIGITGTDGKTTTTNLIYHLLKTAGLKVGMISTVNAVIGNKTLDTGFHVTTPDPRDIQKYLSQMVATGTEYAVLEVTSHALDQNRVWGIPFMIGVLTNITREHLDYHKTYSNYLKAKSKLFKSVLYSILNKDDQSFQEVRKLASGKITTYSLNKESDIEAKDIEYGPEGSEFTYVYQDKSNKVETELIGDFNISNILAAISVCKVLNVSDDLIVQGLKTFRSVPGRMERVSNRGGFEVIIDFAHTPNAVEKALQTMRKISKGKVYVVFGAASERDTGKRPLMGKIAAKLADYVILTNEDPRWEDPNKILTDIAKGVVMGGGTLNKTFWMIEDRAQAIKFAISKAKAKDLVLILGKGHEKSMSIQGKELEWNDKDAVLKALK